MAASHVRPPAQQTAAEPFATRPKTPSTPTWPLNEQSQSSFPLTTDGICYSPPLTSPYKPGFMPRRKPIALHDDPNVRLHQAPASPISISPPRVDIRSPETARVRESIHEDSRIGRRSLSGPATTQLLDAVHDMTLKDPPRRVRTIRVVRDQSTGRSPSPMPPVSDEDDEYFRRPYDPLRYHAVADAPQTHTLDCDSLYVQRQRRSACSSSSGETSNTPQYASTTSLPIPQQSLSRPSSSNTLGSGSDFLGRTPSPVKSEGSRSLSPWKTDRDVAARRSPAPRSVSYVDLLNNVPYDQQIAPVPSNNRSLQTAVGLGASLLDTKKTLEMYRANVKKATDAAVQYEFAVYMVNAAREAEEADGINSTELITEARQILQRLSDRAYPFAQYYLGDGYSSGLFNKDRPDPDKALSLFVGASKHGHAEAGYRAALCFEFGWGTARSYPKAVNFYRTSASKGHPGAATRLGLACVHGDMGLDRERRYREGVKWLKRADEGADAQYNAGPYELGLLHLTGFGADIFKDEAYAAQLLTRSAELGHAEANFRLGRAYETGEGACPRDAARSVHFYTGAAARGHAEAMLALCAWYMVGAPPVLVKDEVEACAWARQAAETGFPKAQYAVGYFTEMGIGCCRDPLEAKVWYVRAADAGSETARQRLEIIAAASTSMPSEEDLISAGVPMAKGEARARDLQPKDGRRKILGLF